MTTPTCRQCGKPTPPDSIHTCSPQQPREWVTYEVQWRSPFSADDEPWDESARPDSPQEALSILRKERNRFPEHEFRAVAITHTPKVIG